jgi:hypothetical protein
MTYYYYSNNSIAIPRLLADLGELGEDISFKEVDGILKIIISKSFSSINVPKTRSFHRFI